jgi:two-component system, cell cycle sensor histidine kinase and response regulator CckA
MAVAAERVTAAIVQYEEQLRQTQKMETLGQLAGGIAHDFNNLLTAIVGHAELLADDLAAGDPRGAQVDGIRQAAETASTLTQQLLAFGRKQMLQPCVLDVNGVVDRTRRVLERIIGEHIELVTSMPRDLWRVKADSSQLEQILLNLAVNARDAMPDGGRLTVQTRNVALEGDAAQMRAVDPGRYVELSVADTGVGMDEEVQQHLFEPFYTTKARGRGTGLGLATVYGIVKQSGGHIFVDSETTRGSRFTIYLPGTSHSADEHAASASHPQGDSGSETVLVVEDDSAVRSLMAAVLRRRGYRLLVAHDGAHALRICDEYLSPIHLLITDVVMPRMNGVAVANAVRERRPDTRVLFVSGYTADAPIDPTGTAAEGFLGKPFTPAVLARKVRAVLAP